MTGDLPGSETSGGGAVIYPPPPPLISTLLSSNGAAGDNTDRHPTEGPIWYLQTSPAGDVDNGAGEAGDVFSHTGSMMPVTEVTS